MAWIGGAFLGAILQSRVSVRVGGRVERQARVGSKIEPEIGAASGRVLFSSEMKRREGLIPPWPISSRTNSAAHYEQKNGAWGTWRMGRMKVPTGARRGSWCALSVAVSSCRFAVH